MSAATKLLAPLALLTGASAAGQAQAALITVTPNADFSATPYNLSFDGGVTTAYTFSTSGTPATGFVNAYGNSIKGTSNPSRAIGEASPYLLPINPSFLQTGSNIGMTFTTGESGPTTNYFGLQFTLGGNVLDGNAAITPAFTLQSVTYDTTPVGVPEPASLALLAAGAAGLVALRRQSGQASAQ